MIQAKDKKQASQFKRQPWEPAGAVSLNNEDQADDYDKDKFKNAKGGELTLEVKEIFHDKGIMNGSQVD